MAMLGLRFDLRVPDFAETTHARQYAAALDMAEWADRVRLDSVGVFANATPVSLTFR